MQRNVDILICGAGIAGISTAYYLSKFLPGTQIYLVDENPPLSLTSDHSTECYRNWWPGPDTSMVSLMNRSIDLMETLANESRNVFQLNRRGYLYLTANPKITQDLIASAETISALGAGPLRYHIRGGNQSDYTPSSPEGYQNILSGADLLLDPDLIQQHYPYLSREVIAGIHVRKAGWLSAQQLGIYLLNEARSQNVHWMNDKVTGIELHGDQVSNVKMASGNHRSVGLFVNAAGPYLQEINRMLKIDLPLISELHLKMAFNDTQKIIARDAPLLIWSDPQILNWSDEEKEFLNENPQTQRLTGLLPPGIHTRPEGGSESSTILILWEYHPQKIAPQWPIPLDSLYPEITLRGLITMVPGLQIYLGRYPKPRLDGGYYIKTPENRPLIGPLPTRGAFVIGALSGFGIMAACAAGELGARHIAGYSLPEYAQAFSPNRYNNPEYLKQFDGYIDTGQL